jgi:hypothetical protein
MMPPNHTVLRWSAYEHEHIVRGSDWYWALGVLTLSIALTSILFHDVLFALLIVAAAITIALLSRTTPDIVEFEISDRGIKTGDTLHRFEEIISFWVFEETERRPLLLVDTIKFMAPNLVIPLENIDIDAVRTYLREHADETPMKEPLSHKILEFFGL